MRSGANGILFTGTTSHDNFLQNSYIGTDFTGTKAFDIVNGTMQPLGNAADGVLIRPCWPTFSPMPRDSLEAFVSGPPT